LHIRLIRFVAASSLLELLGRKGHGIDFASFFCREMLVGNFLGVGLSIRFGLGLRSFEFFFIKQTYKLIK
jgi:hypothetical protein